MLTDQSYAPLKKQMQEYMVYAAAEKGVQMGVDQMKEKTGGQDGTLPEQRLRGKRGSDFGLIQGADLCPSPQGTDAA